LFALLYAIWLVRIADENTGRVGFAGVPFTYDTFVPRTVAMHNGFAGLIATWYQSTRDSPVGSAAATVSRAALT
jgi:hypothetical protein